MASRPDIIAAKLLSGRAPEIIKAIRILPHGKQQDMKPVRLRGELESDPCTQDFFKRVIEQRGKAKENGQEGLANFLKVLANAGSYGLFVEVNTKELPKGERANIQVYSGDIQFPTTSEIVEYPGKWYFPLFGSLITAAGRLMLALIEYAVGKRGGTYLFCDTDSMAIVASEAGGLIPCRGGPYRLPDGREAVKALTWQEVIDIKNEMNRLNPYELNDLTKSILKIEKINFSKGAQRQLYGVAIAAKRYVIYAKTEKGREIVSAKAHGLGFLLPPKKGFDESVKVAQWIVEAWEWILGELFGENPPTPSWFDIPAMMRCTITTPEVLKALQATQANIPYHLRSGKPFNFRLIPILDELEGSPMDFESEKFSLIGPYESDPSKWRKQPYFNIHEFTDRKRKKPTAYRLAKPNTRLSSEAVALTYGDFVGRYRWHPEAKSSGPDGEPCGPRTDGLLSRTPVVATGFEAIGKETDRRWEQGDDISLLQSEVVRYRPHETEKLVVDHELQQKLLKYSIRAVARERGVSENTVKRARRGERLQKRIIDKLRTAGSTIVRTGLSSNGSS